MIHISPQHPSFPKPSSMALCVCVWGGGSQDAILPKYGGHRPWLLLRVGLLPGVQVRNESLRFTCSDNWEEVPGTTWPDDQEAIVPSHLGPESQLSGKWANGIPGSKCLG